MRGVGATPVVSLMCFRTSTGIQRVAADVEKARVAVRVADPDHLLQDLDETVSDFMAVITS